MICASKSLPFIPFISFIPSPIHPTHSYHLVVTGYWESVWCNVSFEHKISVIRKKGESQNKCFKKTKRAKFSEKRTFLTPRYAHVRTCAYQLVRNVHFSENLACFVFLKHPFRDWIFCLITDEMPRLLTLVYTP